MIIGGGISGLATAAGLRRAGIDVAVFESAPDWRKIQVGGGFDVQMNAVRALQQLGLREKVEAIGVQLDRQIMRSPSGELMFEWPYAEMSQKLGVKDVRVMRPDLHRTLAEATGEGVVQLGAECIGFSQDEKGVTARLTDGREERGDLLIGADGINSVVRTQLLGKSEPHYASYAYWQGHINSSHPKLPQGVCQIFFGCGALFGIIPLHERVAWYSAGNAPRGQRDIGKAGLLKRHKGWVEPIEELIQATDDSVIRWLDSADRPPVQRWGEGRVTLLGDAAHAMTNNLAQGACQALEDAAVLTRCLTQNGDVVGALRQYEARRIPRTADVTRRSRRLGRTFALANPLVYAVMRRIMTMRGKQVLGAYWIHLVSYDF
jgi:2-polyprenyl-6-methoxyphenol hydroxylase-like FAD-dependent oxidoreductase